MNLNVNSRVGDFLGSVNMTHVLDTQSTQFFNPPYCCYDNSSSKMLEPLNDQVNPPHHVDCGRLQWIINIEHKVLFKHMSFRYPLLDSHVTTHHSIIGDQSSK